MDEVTQQNAALVEEAAAAAEAMQGQSELLMQSVSIFRLEGGGAVVQKAKREPIKPVAPVKQKVVKLRKEHLPQAGARKLAVAGSGHDGDWSEF